MTSYQTIRIARGRHRSPEEGACVMELSSMLAGERFSDQPRCVDPVIAAFLRALNDRLGFAERQRLKPYAALAVGTSGDRALTRRRRDRCLAAADVRPSAVTRLKLALLFGLGAAADLRTAAGDLAARVVFARQGSAAALQLLDELLGVQAPRIPESSESAPLAVPVAGVS